MKTLSNMLFMLAFSAPLFANNITPPPPPPPPPPEKLAENASTQAFPAIDQIFNSAVTNSNNTPLIADATPNTNLKSKAEIEEITVTGQAETYAGGQVTRSGRIGLLGNKDIFDTPFSISSYTAELIDNQQARTLGDVVRNESSVRQVNSTQQDGYGTVNIRGFVQSNSASLYDGLPGLHLISAMPTEMMERVEVFKGPNALLNNGVSGVGGKINVTPKRPLDRPLTQLTTSYDSRSTLGVHTDLSRRFGSEQQFGARLNAVRRGGESVTKGNKAELGKAALALDYRGERLKLETFLDYQQYDVRGAVSSVFFKKNNTVVPTVPDLGKTTSQPWEKEKSNYTRALMRAEYKLGQDWAAHAAFGTMQAEFSTRRAGLNNVSANGDATPIFQNFADKRKLDSWQGGIRGKFQTGDITHQLALEIAQATHIRKRPKNNNFGAKFNNVNFNIYRPQSFAPLATTNFTDFRKALTIQETSVAIADTLGFVDDRILLTVGLRRQNLGLKVFNRKGATTSNYDKSAVTPSVGLVVKPWDQVSLYSNYIQALERGWTAPRTAVNAGEVLPPSVTEQVEFGVKLDLDGLGLTAGVFQIERPSAYTNASNRFSLDGKQRNRGLELNAFGELQPNLRLLGGITYLNAELTSTKGGKFNGKTAIGVPALRAALNLEYDVPILPGLTLTANAQHMDSAFIRRDNSLKVPAYQLYGIGARYQHEIGDRQLTLRMNVDNLLDKHYWSASPWSENGLYRGSPRRFAISLTMDF